MAQKKRKRRRRKRNLLRNLSRDLPLNLSRKTTILTTSLRRMRCPVTAGEVTMSLISQSRKLLLRGEEEELRRRGRAEDPTLMGPAGRSGEPQLKRKRRQHPRNVRTMTAMMTATTRSPRRRRGEEEVEEARMGGQLLSSSVNSWQRSWEGMRCPGMRL